MEMARIWPVSLQFYIQECGNWERQILKNLGQLAKMIICNWYILYPPTHFLYKIMRVKHEINWFFYAPMISLVWLYFPEALDFIVKVTL